MSERWSSLRLRVLAIEDGVFTIDRRLLDKAFLVGVLMYHNTVEEVFIDIVEVDGLDATEKVLSFINRSKHLDLVLLHGIPYAGFNLIDADGVYRLTGYPIICVLDRKPDMVNVLKALKSRFPDWSERFNMLKKQGEPVEVVLDGRLVLSIHGIPLETALKMLNAITFLGKTPEPLRVARLIAKGLPPPPLVKGSL
ncbi:hypothetical protein DRO58_00045 [Candidatus Bathyarchaeota archaeon]|nr:MAG: hypothetical protein DRO58_00045 [Candidatus Bathyarchaeota archaeon]